MDEANELRKRKFDNEEIIEHISNYLKRYPEETFNGALISLGVVAAVGNGVITEDSGDTLERIRRVMDNG